ncbi:hypothetical protein MTYP_00847 [Methylophilaceae bacterium]|nr:hypothetical protein MTYP_00847 [Methylophilaceae bacterium]
MRLNIKITNVFERKYVELLIYILIGLMTFLVSTHFSKDWKHYNFLFGIISQLSWGSLWAEFSLFKEPLYFFSSKAIGQWVGFPSFIMLATTSLLAIKLYYLKKISQDEYWGIFFYICLYLLLFEGTAVRVGYAVALVIPALYLIHARSYLYAFLLILLASQIHFTTIIYLIAFPIFFYKSLYRLIYGLVLIAPIIVLLDISILNLLKDLIVSINPKYLYYFKEQRLINQNSTGLYYYFIVFFMVLLSVIYLYLKHKINKDRWLSMVFCINLVGVILMCVFHDIVSVGARLGELLLVPIVIMLSQLYVHFRENKLIFQQYSLVSVFVAYFLARLVYLYPTLFQS